MNNQETFEDRFPFLNSTVLEARIQWSIRLRWLAISSYFIATFIIFNIFEYNLPKIEIWSSLAILAVINLIYFIITKLWTDFSVAAEVVMIHVHITIDLIFLAVLLHYSGGIENPVFLFFIFHVVLSSILFSQLSSIIYSVLTICLFSTLVILEAYGIIAHYTIFDPHIHQNLLYVYVTILIFSSTVGATNYICTGFMKIYRDSKRIIDSQNRKLIAADKQKTSFFQFASHELKSPVIAIKSTLDVVNKGYSGKIEPKAADLLKRAIARSEQMLKIINELLDLSHSRNIEDKRAIETIDVHELILNTLDNEKSNAEQKNISCLRELKSQNSIIQINSDDLVKIFSNLIGNAIRYGKENGKVIVRTTEVNDRIFIQVEDDGIGIAEEDLENIFKEFYRSQNAKKVASFGTGLGLSLVKQLVENSGGSIRVESVVGTGTKFTIGFPLHRS